MQRILGSIPKIPDSKIMKNLFRIIFLTSIAPPSESQPRRGVFSRWNVKVSHQNPSAVRRRFKELLVYPLQPTSNSYK